MKSAIFESINDRQNIANAYLKMVQESSGEDDLSHAFEGKQYPLTVHDGKYDDFVADLYDIDAKYKSPEYYETGSEDYYISFAFDNLGVDGVYRKLLEEEPEYCQSEQEILRAGCTYSIKDVMDSIENIGREIINDYHKDDVEVLIPDWASVYYENGDGSALDDDDIALADNYERSVKEKGYSLVYDGEYMGFCPYPEFGKASNCVKYYLVKDTNESVEDGIDGWFDSNGYILRKIPRACVDDCSRSGDASDACGKWVNYLEFADGLDIPMAKGFLKATGGYTDEEISSMSTDDVAKNLLWIICGDIKEGMSPMDVYIGQYGSFGDESLGESVGKRKVKVILTGIEWPKGKAINSDSLVKRDSIPLEIGDGDNMEKIVKKYYVESTGIAPVRFNIAKTIEISPSPTKKNEVMSQKELDKLKKKNPNLKDISETK